jgi:hypothetical protein
VIQQTLNWFPGHLLGNSFTAQSLLTSAAGDENKCATVAHIKSNRNNS